MPAKYRLLVR